MMVTLTRYVVFAMPSHLGWSVAFPEFADMTAAGDDLQEALDAARQQLSDRLAVLKMLGVTMPPPVDGAAVRNSPYYHYSLPAIIAIPGRRKAEGDNVYRFG